MACFPLCKLEKFIVDLISTCVSKGTLIFWRWNAASWNNWLLGLCDCIRPCFSPQGKKLLEIYWPQTIFMQKWTQILKYHWMHYEFDNYKSTLSVKVYSYDWVFVEIYLKLKALVCYFGMVLLRNLLAITVLRIFFSLSQLNSNRDMIYYFSFVVSTSEVTWFIWLIHFWRKQKSNLDPLPQGRVMLWVRVCSIRFNINTTLYSVAR